MKLYTGRTAHRSTSPRPEFCCNSGNIFPTTPDRTSPDAPEPLSNPKPTPTALEWGIMPIFTVRRLARRTGTEIHHLPRDSDD